ncbi:MAG: T9SS type A sorting domain-containing protein [Bacteroidales bacterium]|nr:T9SS type A sorting domain-containing protein [Bacteroidales bacterium]MCF8390126.1 T9SS type A sorting domain-containing protein [Bacteroidales bacterium]
MKKIYFLLIALLVGNLTYGQTLIVGQDFDNETSWAYTTDPAAYGTDTDSDVWASVTTLGRSDNGLDLAQNGVKFWGMHDLDNPWVSNPVDDPLAPGLGLTAPYDHTMVFEDVTLTGKTEVNLSFYYNAYSLNAGYLKIELFYNNVSQGEEMVFSDADGTATVGGWVKFTKAIPDGLTTLGLIFHSYNNQDYMAMDNILLEAGGSSPVCDLALGTTTAVCDAVTDGVDTYTATVAYTGGAAETFVVAASSGMVSGDDPTSVAAGTIIISGIVEGTDVTLTITSALCNAEVIVTAPNCVPEEPKPELPIVDHFDYTEGTALTASELWTQDGTGDSVFISAGNLSYSDLQASSGNSVSFSADGAESLLSFTPVTTGKVYFSFIFKVSDITNWTKGGYFVSLGNFQSRLNIQPIGNQFGIGIAKVNSLAEVIWLLSGSDSVKFDVDSEIFVVMNYDVDAGTSEVWINPAGTDLGLETAPASALLLTGADMAEVGKFVIRQDSESETPTIVMDELRVGVTWASVTPRASTNSIDKYNSKVTVYPNPVSNGYFSIQSTSNAEKHVKIFNDLGQQVYYKVIKENQMVDVTSLGAGIYFVMFEEKGNISTEKILITKE